MKPCLLEALEAIAARIHLAGLAERRTQIAHHEPATAPSIGFLQLVDRVVVVFQIGAVEHQQDDQQSVQLVRADERVLLPPTDSSRRSNSFSFGRNRASLSSCARVPSLERPRRQVVNRLLVVAESPENAREQDLRLRLGADLRAPFHAVRIRDGVFRAEARCVAL